MQRGKTPSLLYYLKLKRLTTLSKTSASDGRNIHDWIYVDDHCEGIWQAFLNGKKVKFITLAEMLK